MGLGVGWERGRLPWIPTTLSTLRSATSPRLSAIRLDFARPPPTGRSVDALIKALGDDLKRVAGEVARIEREFEGAINLTVLLDTSFRVACGALNVRFTP